MIQAIKALLVRATEALLAIGAVLLFFLLFMAVIGLFFPKGQALGALVLSGGRQGLQSTGSRIDLNVTGAESFIAVLTEAHRSVKNKPADAIAWSDANEGMPLGERHSVQTLSGSGAVISFDGDDRLELDEESLVVIRSMKFFSNQRRKRTSVVALEGTLRGRIEPGTAEAAELEIEVVTASGTTQFRADEDRNADFDVRVNPDETTTFSVRSGSAEVTSAGKTVTLEPGQTLTVDRSQPPGRPVPLPAAPTLREPADGSAVVFRSVPPPVEFEWGGETDIYHLEIGRDPGFNEVVYAEQVQGPRFVHGNLPAGRLYWRVTALAGWAEGPTGPPQSLDLIQDTQAPELRVSFPEGSVPVSGTLLHGITEPGARLFVADDPVPLGEAGSFEYALSLDPGLNLVVVEAIDAAGNVTYRSKLINAEHERWSR